MLSLRSSPAELPGPDDHGAEPLQARLRRATAPVHAELERLLGLPASVRDIDDYACCLRAHLGLHEPLEAALARFGDWDAAGIDLPARRRAAALTVDLRALGHDPAQVTRAPVEALPVLPTFHEALGALYVLEGSTLGGRVIARDLRQRLGPDIAAALAFFDGRGDAAGSAWRGFCAALNAHGAAHPDAARRVVTGAQRSFAAYVSWFSAAFQGTGSGS
ncbi:bacteriophytochrome heme oxygenase BphO [Rhodovastum atsumiense]|nr:biliverdin-producing heme oxygenase [Rhodovastum atsumiense]CAH2598676.1 bacteriophytochrome heme oxygenase BphO [Rhodovastum atsumiense]